MCDETLRRLSLPFVDLYLSLRAPRASLFTTVNVVQFIGQVFTTGLAVRAPRQSVPNRGEPWSAC